MKGKCKLLTNQNWLLLNWINTIVWFWVQQRTLGTSKDLYPTIGNSEWCKKNPVEELDGSFPPRENRFGGGGTVQIRNRFIFVLCGFVQVPLDFWKTRMCDWGLWKAHHPIRPLAKAALQSSSAFPWNCGDGDTFISLIITVTNKSR